jgi:hypothetical protein
MPRTGWTPSIVPKGDDQNDQNVYLVVEFGRNGRPTGEADVETTDQETVIADLLDGLGRRFQRRREVVARSIGRRGAGIAPSLRSPIRDVSYFLQDFVDRYEGRAWRPASNPVFGSHGPVDGWSVHVTGFVDDRP